MTRSTVFLVWAVVLCTIPNPSWNGRNAFGRPGYLGLLTRNMTDCKDLQLIETIRVEPGRVLPLLAGHQQRLAASCQALGYAPPGQTLHTALEQHLDGLDPAHTHRLRLLVNRDGSFSLTSNPLAPTPQ